MANDIKNNIIFYISCFALLCMMFVEHILLLRPNFLSLIIRIPYIIIISFGIMDFILYKINYKKKFFTNCMPIIILCLATILIISFYHLAIILHIIKPTSHCLVKDNLLYQPVDTPQKLYNKIISRKPGSFNLINNCYVVKKIFSIPTPIVHIMYTIIVLYLQRTKVHLFF